MESYNLKHFELQLYQVILQQTKTFGSPTVSTIFSGTSPNRIRWAGDPISAFDFGSTTIMPSFKQRLWNSAHSYSGLEIADKVPLHDVETKHVRTFTRRFPSRSNHILN